MTGKEDDTLYDKESEQIADLLEIADETLKNPEFYLSKLRRCEAEIGKRLIIELHQKITFFVDLYRRQREIEHDRHF